MTKRSMMIRPWVIFAAFLLSAPAANAVPTAIGALTVPNVNVDFDSMAAGVTTLAAINAAFPTANLSGLSFATRSGTGSYNFQTGGGRALAPDNLAGGLELINVGGGFQNWDTLTINLGTVATEFGFELGDYSSAGPHFQVELLTGGFSHGTVLVDTSGTHGPHFIARSGGGSFNRIVLGPVDDNAAANYVVPALYIQTTAAPEPATLAIFGLGLAGLGALRRRRQAA